MSKLDQEKIFELPIMDGAMNQFHLPYEITL